MENPAKAADARSSRFGIGEVVDSIDDIADRANRLEFIGLDLLPDELLNLHDQIDGIDAVEVEIVLKIGLERDRVLRRSNRLTM